jgi:hypothetical protein
MGTVANLGVSGLTKGLISGVGASYLGAPSSVAADYGFSNIAPGPMAALRAIADSARIGYADKRTRDAFQGLAFSPPDQLAEYQAAVKTGYDNPEAFSPEQELQNELTNRAMAAYNENKSWGNTLSALGRDVWGGVLSLLSGKPFKYEPVPPGFVAPMDILSRGEDAMDPNQSIGSLSPNDRMDPFSGPATPENPEREPGGWGWGDVGLGGSGLGGDSGGGISSAGDYGGDRGMGRDDGGGGYR